MLVYVAKRISCGRWSLLFLLEILVILSFPLCLFFVRRSSSHFTSVLVFFLIIAEGDITIWIMRDLVCLDSCKISVLYFGSTKNLFAAIERVPRVDILANDKIKGLFLGAKDVVDLK